MRSGRRKAGFLSLVLAPALFLAACGGSTVDSSEVTTTATSTTETTTGETTETSSPETEATSEAQAHDDAAARADELPDNRLPLSVEDEAFLDTLEGSDIDVEGTEDQIIAAARTACGDTDDSEILIEAVAGQLITQERTDLSESEVSEIIADAAESAYC